MLQKTVDIVIRAKHEGNDMKYHAFSVADMPLLFLEDYTATSISVNLVSWEVIKKNWFEAMQGFVA